MPRHLLLLLLLTPASFAQDRAPEIEPAIRAVYPALVRIHVVTQRPSSGRMLKMRVSGSGTIIDQQGHVLTNHHVAGKATRLRCRLSDRTELDATLVGTDPLTDLAVLKLDLSEWPEGRKLPVATFGDSASVKVGDVVLAMGSPAGLSQSVTRGIASNVAMISPQEGGMRLDGENVGLLVRWIGHDAVIYHGNSGGPLVNLDGRIIGVNEVGIGSLGGAIPSNLARTVAKQLIAHGTVQRSWTGIEAQPLTEPLREQGGVLVAGVIADSPAARAGLEPGDVITRYAGEAVHVTTAEELPLFYKLVLSTEPGSEVALSARRDGAEKAFTLTTQAREASRGEDREVKAWGITARDFTLMSAIEFRRNDTRGVQVHSARNGGPAREAKPPLESGDVIMRVGGVEVASIAELIQRSAELVQGEPEPIPVLVAFDRGTARMMTVVQLGPEQDTAEPTQVKKPWLGIQFQVLTRDLARALDLKGKKGVRVTEVLEDTPAHAAGLQVGDVVIALAGERILASEPEDRDVFSNMVRQYRVDSKVDFDLLRDGVATNVVVTLSARPTPEEELPRYEDDLFEFAAREVSFGDRKRLEVDSGVLISEVKEAGWAALAGVRANDFLLRMNGETLDSVPTLKKVMGQIREQRPDHVVGFIRRGIHTRFVEFEPDWSNEP